MIVADVSLGLQVVAVLLGSVGGGVAVYLAKLIPPRMGVDVRTRPVSWWTAAIVAGACFGWFAAQDAGWSLLPALMVFGGTTLALALIDLDHQLIPNRILFPGLAIAAILLAGAAVADGEATAFVRGLLAGIVYFLFLLVVALIARGGFGMGDVKLALLLGLFLGYVGWGALAVGMVVAILLGGVASLLVLLLTRKGRDSKFAYGPYLVAGSWIGLFWGQAIADRYLGTGG